MICRQTVPSFRDSKIVTVRQPPSKSERFQISSLPRQDVHTEDFTKTAIFGALSISNHPVEFDEQPFYEQPSPSTSEKPRKGAPELN